MEKIKKYSAVKLILIAAVFVLGIRYFEEILGFLGTLKGVFLPLFLGCAMAYVLNIVMSALEKIYFPKKDARWVERTRRPVCMVASILTVTGIVFLIIRVVVPELLNAIILLGEGIPVYVEKVINWAVDHSGDIPALNKWLESLEIDWAQMIRQFLGGVTGILNSTVSLVGVVSKSVVNVFMGLIFAIYLLLNKEKLLSQAGRILRVYMKEESLEKLIHVVTVTHKTFTSFITGQCTEAVILGSLCTVGMLLFRFPYAPMVGALVGATALLPVVGAYIGAVVGAFMILTVSWTKVIPFVIFLVILQQLEGNLIYPRVVGASIGLPGMWVLAAVTVGGGLGGIGGMLLGVPLAATLYKLFSEHIHTRECLKEKSEDCSRK